MGKIWLVVILCITSSVFATPDISFSSDDEGPEYGYWAYDAALVADEGTFSFVQPIGIDAVQGDTTDGLTNALVYIPDLYVSDLVLISGTGTSRIYEGLVTALPEGSAEISIQTTGGRVVIEGTLANGGLITVGATASFYPSIAVDIEITFVDWTYVSSVLSETLYVGSFLNFDLTLQSADMDISKMILQNEDVAMGSTLSGSMSIIPEPATLVLLGLGGLLLRRKK